MKKKFTPSKQSAHGASELIQTAQENPEFERRRVLLNRAADIYDNPESPDQTRIGVWSEIVSIGNPGEFQQSQTSSWNPVDLGPYLNGEITEEPPSIFMRSDELIAMLTPGNVHLIFGDGEAGKTMFAAEIGRAHV